MDYLDIVLQGYFNENNRDFLEKYYFREFKKAEKEQFFEADEFFNGCIKVIESWEKSLQDKVFERKNELHLMQNGAKNGTMKYGDLQGKTIKEKRQETIEYCEQELKDVRPDGIGSLSFTVHLHSLTNGRIAYNMPYNEVLYIKQSILKAFQQTQSQKQALQPQQTEKPKPKLNEVLSEQITHARRAEIANAIKKKYSSYRGKQFKILYEALLKLDLFPSSGKRSTFFRCLQNDGFNISNQQLLEDKYFKTGYKTLEGEYLKSEDEQQCDTIVEYLKTIIETN